MSYKPSAIRTMKDRQISGSTATTNLLNNFTNYNNNNNNDNAIIDEDLSNNEIDSPNLLATSVENNSLLSSNSTISLLSLNKPSMSRTTSFTNPLMFQRVQFRRLSNNTQQQPSSQQPQVQPISIDSVPETPNLDPISIQNSPSNFWLNKPMIKRQSSVTMQHSAYSPFLVPVRDHDGSVTPLILSPKKE